MEEGAYTHTYYNSTNTHIISFAHMVTLGWYGPMTLLFSVFFVCTYVIWFWFIFSKSRLTYNIGSPISRGLRPTPTTKIMLVPIPRISTSNGFKTPNDLPIRVGPQKSMSYAVQK